MEIGFKKAGVIFLLLFFSLLFFFVGDNPNSEAKFHYYKALNQCEATGNIHCDVYPAFYHWVASFFLHDYDTFKIFNIFLFIILLPTVLFVLTKTYWVYWFYFSLVNIPFLVFQNGNMANLALLLVWLVFLISHNRFKKLFLFSIGIFTHSNGFWLIGITWFLQETMPFFLKYYRKHKPVFPILIPISEPVFEFGLTKQKILFFFQSAAWPLLVFGFFELVKKKNYVYLGVIFVSVIYFLANVQRAILPAELLVLTGFCSFFINSTIKIKKVILAISLVFLFFNIGIYLRF